MEAIISSAKKSSTHTFANPVSKKYIFSPLPPPFIWMEGKNHFQGFRKKAYVNRGWATWKKAKKSLKKGECQGRRFGHWDLGLGGVGIEENISRKIAGGLRGGGGGSWVSWFGVYIYSFIALLRLRRSRRRRAPVRLCPKMASSESTFRRSLRIASSILGMFFRGIVEGREKNSWSIEISGFGCPLFRQKCAPCKNLFPLFCTLSNLRTWFTS